MIGTQVLNALHARAILEHAKLFLVLLELLLYKQFVLPFLLNSLSTLFGLNHCDDLSVALLIVLLLNLLVLDHLVDLHELIVDAQLMEATLHALDALLFSVFELCCKLL